IRSTQRNHQEPEKPSKQPENILSDEEQALQRIVDDKRGEASFTVGDLAAGSGDDENNKLLDDEDDDDEEDDTPFEVDEEQVQQWRSEDKNGVYDALDELETEISLENPYMKLEFAELQDKIKYMEQGKHLLFPMIFKFVVMPSIYAWGLYKVSATNKIAKGFVKMMDIHFWTCVVAAPMILLGAKRMVRKEEPMPEAVQNMSPEAQELLLRDSFFTRWELPEASCKDHVFFLLQYWASAVKGMLLVPLMNIVGGKYLALPTSGMSFWTASTQFLTRTAAVASLYQYPEMLYRLQRSTQMQMRPIGFFPTVMQKMVGAMLQLAPIGLISDFSKILASLSKKFTYPLYTSIFILLYGFWFRAFEAEKAWKENPIEPFCEIPPMKTKKKLLYTLSLLLLWRMPILSFTSLIQPTTMRRLASELMFTNATPFFWSVVFAFATLLLIPLVGPAIHLAAISRVFRVSFCRDAPLVTEASQFDPEDNDWRYWISWREPMRLGLVKKDFKSYLWYLFERKGTEDDFIEKLKAEDLYEDMKPSFLWNRLQREKEENPKAFKRESPSTWKAKAMRTLKRIHKENYENRNFSEDPLGIVLYRGFNIGLGLDHFAKAKELKDGEGGSRAVQAKAVEKAIHRYNTLNTEAKEEEEAEKNMDAAEQNRLKEERDDRIDTEIRYLGERLKELVPTTFDDALVDPDERLNKFLGKYEMPHKFERISSHEYRIIRDSPPMDLSDPLADTRVATDQTVQISPSVKAILGGTTDDRPLDLPSGSVGIEKNEGNNEKEKKDDDDDDDDDWEPTIVYA
ncbi:MAG: hypothetical protein SGARI_000878, partial [Bacillariaceae sp.]